MVDILKVFEVLTTDQDQNELIYIFQFMISEKMRERQESEGK